MSAVFSITPFVWTSEDSNSGTDGPVYMGIGGREFRLDSPRGAFQPGNAVNTTVGKFSEVTHPEMNDPRTPLTLTTETLDLYPVYFRVEGNDHWKAWNALIWVISGSDEDNLSVTDWFVADIDSSVDNGVLRGGLWLGPESGRWLFLRRGNSGNLNQVVRSESRLLREAERLLERSGVTLAEC